MLKPPIRSSDTLRTGQDCRIDYWSGSAEALVSAGVAEVHEFPGQPGRNTCVVTIRPVAGLQGAKQWAAAPGYRRIARSGAGFRVEITVSPGERQRREDALTSRRSRVVADRARAIAVWESRPFSAAAERTSGVIVNTRGTWETTVGSREQLIAAGRCDSEHFPEGKKRLRFSDGPHRIWHMEKVPGQDRYSFFQTLSTGALAARSIARAALDVEGNPTTAHRAPLRLVWSAPERAVRRQGEGLRS